MIKNCEKNSWWRRSVAVGCFALLLTAMSAQVFAAGNEERAKQILKTMTWKEKIAQMFIVGVPDDALAVQQKYQFGGYIFLEKDFRARTPKKMQKLFYR